MDSELLKKLTAPGPKRILALDGGGVKGIVTLGFLEKIESILANRSKNPDFRLCDYFDLIGGTSTGSIIAAALAIGKSVAEIKEQYFKLGKIIFGKRKGIVSYVSKGEKYDARPLERALRDQLGDILLGDQENIRCGVCVMTKRAETFSTWPLINHPKGKYYTFNKDIPLWRAVRASVAAPTFFLPAVLQVAPNEKGAFIDGAISMANNPAFQLFLLATLKGYPFHWATGEDNLLVVSLGTGHVKHRATLSSFLKSSVLNWAAKLPEFFLDDANKYNQMLLQYLSNSPTAVTIDGEIGDLRTDRLGLEYALSYLRYSVQFSQEPLKELGFTMSEKQAKKLNEIDIAANIPTLSEIGVAAGEKYIFPRHFSTHFDPESISKGKLRFITGEPAEVDFEDVKKKPVTVQASQINEPFEVMSLEGLVKGKKGDYLMKGVDGEYYICDQKIFNKTYESAKTKKS